MQTKRHTNKQTCSLTGAENNVQVPHTHPFNGPFSETTRVSRYQKGKTNLDFSEARDSEWQWHQLGHMQVCISLQTDNHASTPLLSFLQAGCPSCRPTNSVKALKATFQITQKLKLKFKPQVPEQNTLIFNSNGYIWQSCTVKQHTQFMSTHLNR